MTLDELATRDALALIEGDGSDLTRPLEIDFFVVVPDRAAGEIVAMRAEARGLRTNVECDDASGEWTCYCTITMIPRLDDVVAMERMLDTLAHDVGGFSDGFGTFGNNARYLPN